MHVSFIPILPELGRKARHFNAGKPAPKVYHGAKFDKPAAR
jgi:hypothetical protein